MLKWHTESIALNELKEYVHNPHDISRQEFSKLVKSIKEDGYHQRILVNKDYTIIGGHQRKKALIESGLNLNDRIDVLVPDRLLSEEELDRINIRDNLSFGEYDFNILFDRFNIDALTEFGIPNDMLESFKIEENLSSIEDTGIMEVPTEAKSALGDLYILGNHRLLCGDSTNSDHVDRLLDGSRPILMVTDPPYGVNYEPQWRNDSIQENNSKNLGKVLNDDIYDWSQAYSLFTGNIAYIWKPSRYKIIYGGRGSGKSYGVADALLIISCLKKCLILCGREFQNSIKDSVHSLIRQRIEALSLGNMFEITHDEIRNTSSNSRFIFKGLRHNIDSIKSTAGITHLWIEEADTLSLQSWQVIKPTIREDGSEIWATMNPRNRTDILYKEFIECEEKPQNTYIKKVNWEDNPYFPQVLMNEKEQDKLRDYGLYRHIWEGECLEYSDAQVFKGLWDVQKFEEPKNVHKYYGLDFGFSQDPTAGIVCYVHDNRLYISHEAVKRVE